MKKKNKKQKQLTKKQFNEDFKCQFYNAVNHLLFDAEKMVMAFSDCPDELDYRKEEIVDVVMECLELSLGKHRVLNKADMLRHEE